MTDPAAVLADRVRDFTRRVLVPLEHEVDATGVVPESVSLLMGEMGLFGLTIGTEYGGLGLDFRGESTIIRELCWAAPVFRSLIATNVGVGSQGIVAFGTEEQKARWLPRLASGEVVAAFAMTEDGAGSDVRAMATTVRRDGETLVLSGTKTYVTNGPRAGLVTVMARSVEDDDAPAVLSAVLVDTTTPGVTVHDRRSLLGQSGAAWADITLEDVRVPAEALLGTAGRGMQVVSALLQRSRAHIGVVCLGQCLRLLDAIRRRALERRQFGRPIGDFQLVQRLIADSYIEVCAVEAMVHDVARRIDAGDDSVIARASALKVYATEALARIADRAIQVFGALGLERGSLPERALRDARLMQIAEGTTQLQQLTIARHVLSDGRARTKEHHR